MGAANPAHELGALKETYEAANWTTTLAFLFGASTCLLMGSAILANSRGAGSATSLLFGILSLGMGIVLLANLVMLQPMKVHVHDGGLVLSRGANQVIPWEAIAKVLQESTTTVRSGRYGERQEYTTHVLRLRLANRQEIQLTSAIERFRDLAATIFQAVHPLVRSAAVDALARGETIFFGRYSISPTVLGDGAATVPWATVEGLVVSAGHIVIHLNGRMEPSSVQPVAAIPNVPVFLELANAMVLRAKAAGSGEQDEGLPAAGDHAVDFWGPSQ